MTERIKGGLTFTNILLTIVIAIGAWTLKTVQSMAVDFAVLSERVRAAELQIGEVKESLHEYIRDTNKTRADDSSDKVIKQ